MILAYILGCGLSLFLQAFFVVSEIAFISSRKIILRHNIKKGDKGADIAYNLISRPEKFLSTTLIGINLFMVISSTLITTVLLKLGIANSNIWVTFIFTPFVVIFAELIPKQIGLVLRERWSCRFAGVIKLFEYVFSPIIIFFSTATQFLMRIFGRKPIDKTVLVTKREIIGMLRQLEKQGGLDRGEKEAIEDVFSFRFKKIKDVITPYKKIVAFDYTDSLDKIIHKAQQYKFTRYPVFQNRQIIGYINIFDIFYNNQLWQQSIRPIIRVGESQKLDDVFSYLKNKRENIALVMRGKRILGIVTLEDIMREILTSIIKD